MIEPITAGAAGGQCDDRRPAPPARSGVGTRNRWRSRPFLAVRGVALGTVLVAVAACSTGQKVPDGYGATTETNFNEGCTTALTSTGDVPGEPLGVDVARQVCGCAYESISDPDTGIPFDEFDAIDDELAEDPAPLPEPLRVRIEACASDIAPPS